MDTKLVLAFLYLHLVSLIYVSGQTNEGDACVVRDGGAGICKKINHCPAAMAAAAKRERPSTCSYKNNKAVVCCKTIKQSVISKNMCKRYAEYVYVKEETASSLFDDDESTSRTPVCAQAAQELIVGGTKASPQEFPHMAALGYGDDESNIRWLCGGSLISNRYILTAAHCVYSPAGGKVKWALLGELNYLHDDDNTEPMLTEVIEATRHPDYHPPVHYNDIALLKLKHDVTFNTFVRPACLATGSVPLGLPVTATGWGLLKNDDEVLSPDLMKVTLRVVQATSCNAAFRSMIKLGTRLSRGLDDRIMICAGDTKGVNETFKDTCGGDSGGPLQINLETPYCMYSIVGLTSFGNAACGLSPAPAVYTRVSHFVPWIESIVWTK